MILAYVIIFLTMSLSLSISQEISKHYALYILTEHERVPYVYIMSILIESIILTIFIKAIYPIFKEYKEMYFENKN